jgi:hypothetical protein
MLRYAHFDLKGEKRKFAVGVRALGRSGESGRLMRGQIHKCCKRSNGGSEPNPVIDDPFCLEAVGDFM